MMREKLQKIQVKRLVILNLPYFFIFYVADKGSWLYRHCLGESMVQRLGVMLVNFRLAFLSWLPSIALQDLTVGVLVASALKLVVYYRSKNAKKFRQGVEYGSARWGNRKDIEPFMDPVFENNVILTETERLTMNSRPKAPKYARNKNVIVIGGSGSGKTRFYVKPNLMQMTDHVSYVVTDPKGTIIVECGKMLVNGGYTQLFNLLCDKADDEHGGRLPYHVRLLLDEFSNIGQIPKFDKLIATIRSREISASIILQSQSQLKTIYKDAAETITGNCDTVLFLGGKESSTLKEISETLGKETIDLYNTSDTRGSNRSYGLNYQKTGKELMSRDELAVMDGEKCILQLRGVRPFLSNKYDITKHKQYKELADFNKNNAFDVEKYLAHRLVMSEDTEFEMYEVTVTQEDVSAIEAEEGENDET